MEALDLRDLKTGQVLCGAARIAAMRTAPSATGTQWRLLELRSDLGTATAYLPEPSAASAPLEVGSTVCICARVREHPRTGAPVLMIERVEVVPAQHLRAESNQLELALGEESAAGLHLEIPQPLAAYLLWLMCAELAAWDERRHNRLTHEQARAFTLFLWSWLPPDCRTPVPPALLPTLAGSSRAG